MRNKYKGKTRFKVSNFNTQAKCFSTITDQDRNWNQDPKWNQAHFISRASQSDILDVTTTQRKSLANYLTNFLPISDKETQEINQEGPNRGTQSDRQSDFVSQYTINLRKTVYSEAKIMAKELKKQVNYSTGNTLSANNPLAYRSRIQACRNMKFSRNIEPQGNAHSKQIKWKRLVSISVSPHSLEVNRFPPVSRRNRIKALDNALKFPSLATISNGEDQDRNGSGQGCKFSERLCRKKGKKTSKAEINPWETFHDQFPQ